MAYPVGIEDHHAVGTREIQPLAAGTSREEEREDGFVRVKPVDQRHALPHWRIAIHTHEAGPFEEAHTLDDLHGLDCLAEDQHAVALALPQMQQAVQDASLPGCPVVAIAVSLHGQQGTEAKYVMLMLGVDQVGMVADLPEGADAHHVIQFVGQDLLALSRVEVIDVDLPLPGLQLAEHDLNVGRG